MRLKDKVVVVTGGGTGIGKAIAQRFASEGTKVALVGADRINVSRSHYGGGNIGGYTAARGVAAEISQKGEAIAIEADVTNYEQVQAMVSKTVSTFGNLDIVVNCAGIITFGFVKDLSEEDWDSVMAVNAKGTFLVCKAAVTQMLNQGSGRIINISSMAGKTGGAGTAHYAASKAAVIAFTQGFAKEVAKNNITVNAICPGIIGTQMWKLLSGARAFPGETDEQAYQRIVQNRIPQGVPQTGDDIAEAAVFLALSPHVTGQAIVVDGGATA
jgi:meso-butanediol dehydrogenase/(S,S)-butanediol dehydrogenase/diacetyl reductase